MEATTRRTASTRPTIRIPRPKALHREDYYDPKTNRYCAVAYLTIHVVGKNPLETEKGGYTVRNEWATAARLGVPSLFGLVEQNDKCESDEDAAAAFCDTMAKMGVELYDAD